MDRTAIGSASRDTEGRRHNQKQNSLLKCKYLSICQNLGEDVTFLIECSREGRWFGFVSDIKEPCDTWGKQCLY